MPLTNENKKQNRVSISDVQIIHEYKNLPHLSTMNRFLMEFTYILRAFYHLLKFGTVCAFVQRCLRTFSSWTKLQIIFLKNHFCSKWLRQKFYNFITPIFAKKLLVLLLM